MALQRQWEMIDVSSVLPGGYIWPCLQLSARWSTVSCEHQVQQSPTQETLPQPMWQHSSATTGSNTGFSPSFQRNPEHAEVRWICWGFVQDDCSLVQECTMGIMLEATEGLPLNLVPPQGWWIYSWTNCCNLAAANPVPFALNSTWLGKRAVSGRRGISPAPHNVAVAVPMWKQAWGRARPWGAQRTARHCPHWQAASAMRPWWGGQTSARRFCMWQFPRLSILEYQFTFSIYTEKYTALQKQVSIRQLHSTAALKVIYLRKKLHWTSCFKC